MYIEWGINISFSRSTIFTYHQLTIHLSSFKSYTLTQNLYNSLQYTLHSFLISSKVSPYLLEQQMYNLMMGERFIVGYQYTWVIHVYGNVKS